MAIVDAFESMTAGQAQRPLGAQQAAAKIAGGAGKLFDPRLVRAFTAALPLIRKAGETYADHLAGVVDLDFSIGCSAKRARPLAFVKHAKAARPAKARP